MKMSEYCKSIHSNPDAQAWAKFFIETLKEQGWKLEHIDEGLMIGWFAGAMMAMHDHIEQKRKWVGLTDEEVFLISEYPECCQVSIRNAEAKLKEKNT
jgi:hypothetical protein